MHITMRKRHLAGTVKEPVEYSIVIRDTHALFDKGLCMSSGYSTISWEGDGRMGGERVMQEKRDRGCKEGLRWF